MKTILNILIIVVLGTGCAYALPMHPMHRPHHAHHPHHINGGHHHKKHKVHIIAASEHK